MKYSEFIKENYEMFLDIMNHMHTCVWITDSDGVVLLVNNESAKTGGLGRDELVGRNMQELLDEGYIQEASALKTIASKKEETVIEAMGEGGYCLTTSIPMFCNGKLDLVMSIERDISEVVELRNALQIQRDITEKISSRLHQLNMDVDQDHGRMIANSYKMIRVKEMAVHIGSLDATVIVLGESGAGKEVVADLIYESSQRAEGPFIKVNCAAIPESLIESELFGYEGGAFTGAKSGGQKGMFEEADGGTIFLDEIGELPLSMQSKLLRVLENGEIRRVGATDSKSVDVRIIAATNRNLKEEVAAGKFREDLYYRLMILPIFIPPLRERKEDIVPLANMFLAKFNEKYHLNKELSEGAFDELVRYHWPGNVRELRNMIERLVVCSEGDKISSFQVSLSVRGGSQSHRGSIFDFSLENNTLEEMLYNYEKQIIMEVMEKCGTVSATAARLGVNKSTISRKMKAYKESNMKNI